MSKTFKTHQQSFYCPGGANRTYSSLYLKMMLWNEINSLGREIYLLKLSVNRGFRASFWTKIIIPVKIARTFNKKKKKTLFKKKLSFESFLSQKLFSWSSYVSLDFPFYWFFYISIKRIFFASHKSKTIENNSSTVERCRAVRPSLLFWLRWY